MKGKTKMDLENKDELTVETSDSAQAAENEEIAEAAEALAEETSVAEESQKPARKGRGKKQKIETHEEKPQSEWTERVVQIRRVTKVVKGGKKLSFRAIVIVGNQKGQDIGRASCRETV